MKPIYTKNRTIGLLGGSFNPAHEGHLHITLHALKKLHLDEVWWLVSPQNPLKSPSGMASFEQRMQSALMVVGGRPKIRVLDIEKRLHIRYTHEAIAALKKRFPGTRFVWMMGADNLAQFHRWQRWDEILELVPVIVFDRAPYSHKALRSKTMIRGGKFLKFIHLKRNPLSSTGIRNKLH